MILITQQSISFALSCFIFLFACEKNTTDVSEVDKQRIISMEDELVLDSAVENMKHRSEQKANLFSDTSLENTKEYQQKLKSLNEAILDEAQES